MLGGDLSIIPQSLGQPPPPMLHLGARVKAWPAHLCAKSSHSLFSSLCLQGTAKCSACLRPMPRALNCQGPLPAILCGKQSTLPGGRGRESQQEARGLGRDQFISLTKRPSHFPGWGGAGVFREGEKMVLGPSKRPRVQEGGQKKGLLCLS